MKQGFQTQGLVVVVVLGGLSEITSDQRLLLRGEERIIVFPGGGACLWHLPKAPLTAAAYDLAVSATSSCCGSCSCGRLVGDSAPATSTVENERDGERTGSAASRGVPAAGLGAGRGLKGGGGDSLAPRTMSAYDLGGTIFQRKEGQGQGRAVNLGGRILATTVMTIARMETRLEM